MREKTMVEKLAIATRELAEVEVDINICHSVYLESGNEIYCSIKYSEYGEEVRHLTTEENLDSVVGGREYYRMILQNNVTLTIVKNL